MKWHLLPRNCGRHLSYKLQFQPQKRTIAHTSKGSLVTKPTKDLLFAAMIFKLCSFTPLVQHGETLLRTSRKVLGENFTNALLRRTFYKQFCIGDSERDLMSKSREMRRNNIQPLLIITAEKTNLSDWSSGENWFEKNKQDIMRCIYLTEVISKTSVPRFAEIKLTAILDADICVKLSELITKGKTFQLDHWLKSYSEHNNNDELVDIPSLTKTELKHFANSIKRFHEIGDMALSKSIPVLIDAEYCNINPILNYIAIYGMRLYNAKSPIIQYTYQCYLKDSHATAMRDIKLCLSENLKFGCKFVRGAYMDTERKRAIEQQNESPIFDTWSQTNDNYNQLMAEVVQTVADDKSNSFQIMAATHNEESVQNVAELMERYGISKTSGQVVFAQIYGMADHLTCWLADHGFLVYKASPFGSESDSIPYLIRRAQENSSVIDGSRKDRDLIREEIFRRMRRRLRTWFLPFSN